MTELVNVSEASRRTGVPRRTLVTWIGRQRLFPAGLDGAGTKLYRLEDVRRLAQQRRARPR